MYRYSNNHIYIYIYTMCSYIVRCIYIYIYIIICIYIHIYTYIYIYIYIREVYLNNPCHLMALILQDWVFLFTRALHNEDPKTHVQVFGNPYGTFLSTTYRLCSQNHCLAKHPPNRKKLEKWILKVNMKPFQKYVNLLCLSLAAWTPIARISEGPQGPRIPLSLCWC